LLTGRKLLLADDSLTIQKVVSLTFNDEAMEVFAVGSGAEALEHLHGSLPDIILADVFMPEPNGYKLCERIKADKQTRHIPVVLLVGTFEPFNEAEARRVGADEVLTKPFQSIRDLVNKVGGLLGGTDEKPLDAAEEARAARREEETTRDLSPFAAEARDAAPTAESPSSPAPATAAADAFNDFDLDDATIQSTPAAAFDARAQASSSAFSEIRDEEQFSDRGETEEAFALDANEAPVQTHAAAAAGASTSYAASSTTASEVSPVAGTAFSAHAARSAEADDALLELGDIAPAHTNSAAAEADDFILDIGDEDSFDSPVAVAQPTPAHAAEADMFFAEQAQTTEVPEAFDPLDMLGTGTESAPASFAPEPSELEAAPPELEASRQELEAALPELEAPEMTEAPSLLFATETEPEAQAVRAGVQEEEEVSAPVWDGEPAAASAVAHAGGIAPFEAPVESQPISLQEPTPAGGVEASVQSQGTTQASSLSPEMLDEVVRRVVAQMSEQLVREIAWEVVPELAERLIKQRLEEEKTRTTP
jgi:CheY-like chemotaxis protein